jgi:hypothetical protein
MVSTSHFVICFEFNFFLSDQLADFADLDDIEPKAWSLSCPHAGMSMTVVAFRNAESCSITFVLLSGLRPC